MAYWLFKSEPFVYSFDDLCRDGSTWWDGVRNYQARNYLREMLPGDGVVFYHSNTSPPGAAGLATVVHAHAPDLTQFDPTSAGFDPTSNRNEPRWSWVCIAPVRSLRYVPLDTLRDLPALAGTPLVMRGSRLSVFPLSAAAYRAIIAAGR